MGEEDFTEEELEILGESEEDIQVSEEPEPEGEKEQEEGVVDDSPDEESASEAEEQEDTARHSPPDDNFVPQARYNEIYLQKKDLERQLAEKDAKREAQSPPSRVDYRNVPVEGGEYDGLTLEEVAERDPLYAQQLIIDAEIDRRLEEEKARQKKVALLEESQKEIESFGMFLAEDIAPGIKDLDALTEAQKIQVNGKIEEVQDWMDKTGRGGGIIQDAYFLMHKDDMLSKASQAGAENLAKALPQSRPGVSNKKGSENVSVYDKFIGAGRDTLSSTIKDMPEEQFLAFLKNAPPAFKEKVPDLWD
jgi:hypothetical protein